MLVEPKLIVPVEGNKEEDILIIFSKIVIITYPSSPAVATPEGTGVPTVPDNVPSVKVTSP